MQNQSPRKNPPPPIAHASVQNASKETGSESTKKVLRLKAFRKFAYHDKSARNCLVRWVWCCGRDNVFITSISQECSASEDHPSRKINLLTRLCKSRFVIDHLNNVSLSNSRSSHSLLSGKQSCLSTVSISIPRKVSQS